ncbi:hypothetical protein [Novosphingobium malaysiense]|uniref:DUF4261 domain-containing protein n=1 Tax=Novosphingobium malaysiense TaxID=1348853 RepID=A0A0B1ZRP0_9SPHN|nr:hypothetical protein [Novosphingobium malaysiense]KHK91939.1 hypothetical protein LK12_10045 [Novosphingobium malaysiense]
MQNDSKERAGLQILFARNSRPSADDVAAMLDSAESGISARITHRPPSDEGWLELLASGLTFDLRGLAPAAPVPFEPMMHRYGFETEAPVEDIEAVELVASGHIAAGAGLQPVVRMLANLAADLVLRLPARAVVWQPAQTMMEPQYFSRTVYNWLSGGAFPALGLTALEAGADGSVNSTGLSYFIGQDLQLEGRRGEAPVDAVKLAIRLVDYLVCNGPLVERQVIEAGEGGLIAEPSPFQNRVLIWRERA